MKRLCDCGCKRPVDGEWIHPTLGVFTFSAHCNLRNQGALEDNGWSYFGPLDDRADEAPRITHNG